MVVSDASNDGCKWIQKGCILTAVHADKYIDMCRMLWPMDPNDYVIFLFNDNESDTPVKNESTQLHHSYHYNNNNQDIYDSIPAYAYML